MKLWYQLCRSIIPLDNQCPPQNIGNPTEDLMALISKIMWYLPNKDEPRVKLTVPLHHALVNQIDAIWFELVCHVLFHAYSICIM